MMLSRGMELLADKIMCSTHRKNWRQDIGEVISLSYWLGLLNANRDYRHYNEEVTLIVSSLEKLSIKYYGKVRKVFRDAKKSMK